LLHTAKDQSASEIKILSCLFDLVHSAHYCSWFAKPSITATWLHSGATNYANRRSTGRGFHEELCFARYEI